MKRRGQYEKIKTMVSFIVIDDKIYNNNGIIVSFIVINGTDNGKERTMAKYMKTMV